MAKQPSGLTNIQISQVIDNYMQHTTKLHTYGDVGEGCLLGREYAVKIGEVIKEYIMPDPIGFPKFPWELIVGTNGRLLTEGPFGQRLAQQKIKLKNRFGSKISMEGAIIKFFNESDRSTLCFKPDYFKLVDPVGAR